MSDKYPVEQIAREIRSIKKSAEKLKSISGDVEAVERNVDRILASVRMLEINIGDISEIYK